MTYGPVARAILAGYRQQHRHTMVPASVSYPSALLMGGNTTNVLFRCTGCTEPGGYLSLALSGRWTMPDLTRELAPGNGEKLLLDRIAAGEAPAHNEEPQ